MRRFGFVQTGREKLAFGVFFLAVLFLARDTLVTSSILGFAKSQVLLLGLLCLAGAAFVWRNRRDWKEMLLDRRMAAAVIFAAVILVPMLWKRDWQLMYFSILIGLFFAVFLSYFLSYEEAAKYYVVIMTVLAAYSVLATYILRLIFIDSGMGVIPTFRNQTDLLFHNFGLAFVSDIYVKNRNFGIFREPGVYQFFLILALFLNNYTLEWDRGWKYWSVNVILAVTMLTTFATGGGVELGMLALIVFFEKKLYRDKRILVIAVVLVAAFVGLVLWIIRERGTLYWELYAMFVSKFAPEEDSFSERKEAIVTNLRFFLANPMVGNRLSTVLHAVANNTSSTLVMFAGLGFGGGLLHVASWFALIWDRKRKIWANLGLVLLMFMSFNTQNLTADLFFWLFPCMALIQRGLPMIQLPERKVR